MNENTFTNSENVMMPNVLYKSYASKALFATVSWMIIAFITSIFINNYTSLPLYGSYYILLDSVTYTTTWLYMAANVLSWLLIVFAYLAVKGFARAQIVPSDASAVNTVAKGLMYTIVAWALSYITWTEPSFTLPWYLFISGLSFLGFAFIIIGLRKLNNSQSQPEAARKGFNLLLLFTIFELISLYVSFNCVVLSYIVYSDIYHTILNLTYVADLLLLPMAVVGIKRVITCQNDISIEQYNETCLNNIEAKSEPRTLQLWLYGMGAIFTLAAFDSIYWEHSQYHQPNDFIYLLYNSILGYIGDIYRCDVFILVFTLVLGLWMLSRYSSHQNMGVKSGIAIMIAAAVVPIFIKLFVILFQLSDYYFFDWECGAVTAFLLYISIITITLSYQFKLYYKIVITTLLLPPLLLCITFTIPYIIGNIFDIMFDFQDYVIRNISNISIISTLFTSILAVIFWVFGALAVPDEKSLNHKKLVIAFAILLATILTYGHATALI